MPNIERSCTYAQSLNYIRKYCTFIQPAPSPLCPNGAHG